MKHTWHKRYNCRALLGGSWYPTYPSFKGPISQFQRINIPFPKDIYFVILNTRCPNIPNSSWISQYPSFIGAISQYPRKNGQNIPDWANRALKMTLDFLSCVSCIMTLKTTRSKDHLHSIESISLRLGTLHKTKYPTPNSLQSHS